MSVYIHVQCRSMKLSHVHVIHVHVHVHVHVLLIASNNRLLDYHPVTLFFFLSLSACAYPLYRQVVAS